MKREQSEYMSDTFVEDIYFEATDHFKSKRTKEEYFGVCCLVCDFLKKDFLDITRKDAERYIKYLNGLSEAGSLSLKTRNVRLAALKSVCSNIEEKQLCPGYKNPFEKLSYIFIDDAPDLNKVPSMEDIDKILSVSYKENKNIYYMIVLISRMALSATKVITLKTSDLTYHDNTGYLRVIHKQNEKKLIAMPEDVSKIFKPLYVENKEIDGNIPLFSNSYGKPYSLRTLNYHFERVLIGAGLEDKYSIKDFRTRAILDMTKAGAEMNDLVEYTGLSVQRLVTYKDDFHIVKSCPGNLVNYRIIERNDE